MGYANMILATGEAEFAARLAEAGAAGAIVPDLPLGEGRAIREAFNSAGLALVPLIAPTTSPERRQRDLRPGRGLRLPGLDGGSHRRARGAAARAGRADRGGEERAPVPVAVGFGISTPEQVAAVGAVADGVIIGSRLVRAVQDAPDADAAAAGGHRVPAARRERRCRGAEGLGRGARDRGEEIAAAHAAVAADVHATPTLRLPAIDEMLGGPIALKAENLQQTGSFKARGVSVKLDSLGEECAKGVVAGTAGNHGRALAWAARRRGVPCELFVPEDAPISKTEPAAELGASVDPLQGHASTIASSWPRSGPRTTGSRFVHPFDDPKVVTGQGGIGLELLEDVPDLAKVLVPLGGGGLACRDSDRRQVSSGPRSRSSECRSRPVRVSGLAREGRGGDRTPRRRSPTGSRSSAQAS